MTDDVEGGGAVLSAEPGQSRSQRQRRREQAPAPWPDRTEPEANDDHQGDLLRLLREEAGHGSGARQPVHGGEPKAKRPAAARERDLPRPGCQTV